MINIHNESEELSTEQYIYLIGLLGNQYNNLDVEVHIIDSKQKGKKYKRYMTSQTINKSPGFSNTYFNTIFILDYNMTSTKAGSYSRKLSIIMTLYHELRHKFQDTYLTSLAESKIHNIANKKYPFQEKEMDASLFASNFMTLNHDAISNIIGFGLWEVQPNTVRTNGNV